MLKIISAKSCTAYKIWLRYSDGVEGEVDLSHLVGKGVFSAWKDKKVFQSFRVKNGRVVIWTDEIDLCADSLYLEITGKTPEDVFPMLRMENVNA